MAEEKMIKTHADKRPKRSKPDIPAYKLYGTTTIGGIPIRPCSFCPLDATPEEVSAGFEKMLEEDPLSVFFCDGTQWFTGEDRVQVIANARRRRKND